MKKYNCPDCGKELIRLEPYQSNIFEFLCDDCAKGICITDLKAIKYFEVSAITKEEYEKRVRSETLCPIKN